MRFQICRVPSPAAFLSECGSIALLRRHGWFFPFSFLLFFSSFLKLFFSSFLFFSYGHYGSFSSFLFFLGRESFQWGHTIEAGGPFIVSDLPKSHPYILMYGFLFFFEVSTGVGSGTSFFWGFLGRLYRALRGCSCGSRGFLEARMMDIITGRTGLALHLHSDYLYPVHSDYLYPHACLVLPLTCPRVRSTTS